MMSFLLLSSLLSAADTPPSAAPFDLAGHVILLSVHASGAQIYECRAASGEPPAWSFREPVATLINDDKTIGRHYAGPTWALNDGSAVTGKQAATAPGALITDIAQLKLDVISHSGHGKLDHAAHIYRVETHGGKLAGACLVPGALQADPYDASYLFTD